MIHWKGKKFHDSIIFYCSRQYKKKLIYPPTQTATHLSENFRSQHFIQTPLFNIEHLLAFADGTFILRVGDCLTKLITNMEKSLKAITTLQKSGLIVNKEICAFN